MKRDLIPWAVALGAVLAGVVVGRCGKVAEVQVAYAVGSVAVVVVSLWYGISPWSRFGPPPPPSSLPERAVEGEKKGGPPESAMG